MNLGKYVFYQIFEFINRYEFNKCVKCYNGDLGVRDLDCWNQFLQLLFGQLSSLNSLRNICVCLKQHSKKLYHLGIKQYVNVSTLSRANIKRDWRIFADFGLYLIEKVRLVDFYDSDKGEIIEFLTNNFEISAFEVAILYKNRWKIETFFKFIKQNLTIKKLWGHSENAVKIHIWVAIITYLLIAYIKKILKSPLSIYEMIELLGISLFDKTPIQELISDTEIELNMYQQLRLFDF